MSTTVIGSISCTAVAGVSVGAGSNVVAMTQLPLND
jgi:hypothetical protein